MKLEVDNLKRNMKVIFKPMSQLVEELGFNKEYDGDYIRYTKSFRRHRELINSDMVWHLDGLYINRIIEVGSDGIYDFRYETSKGSSWCANCSWVLRYSKDGAWYNNEDYTIDFELGEELFVI